METILLTSAGMDMADEIRSVLCETTGKTPSHIRIAHVITASLVESNVAYVEKERNIMKEQGYEVIDVDLVGKNEDELREELSHVDVLYVQGGNTFFLLKHVKESGFDVVAKEMIVRGVPYVGVSAGGYISCPTIEMATWKGQDENESGLKDLSGMGLVPFLVFVHFEENCRKVLSQQIPLAGLPVRILTDTQALLVQDGKVQLLGDKPEVLIH